MRITDEIFQVGGSGLSANEDAAVYLIRFGNHSAVVDAGCGDSVHRIMDNIADCGVRQNQVDYLFLTHCHFDHTGGAKALADALSCPIAAHEKDAVFLESGDSNVTAASWYGRAIAPFTVDIKIKGDGRIFKTIQTNRQN